MSVTNHVGDRNGNLVYVKNPFGDGHVWLDITSGQIEENKCCGSCRDNKGYVRQKQDVVKLIRYVRPVTYLGIDNMRGLTFYIELDYKNHDIRFSFSRCEGDNFDKTLGKTFARENYRDGDYFVLKMNQGGVSAAGVLSDILEYVKNCWSGLKEQKPVLRQFYDAGYR